MKTRLIAFVMVLAAACCLNGQEQGAAHQVVERGANHRVWSKTIVFTNALGQVSYRTNSYTELASGLHYVKEGQWTETKAEVELAENGAAATNGPHKVFFAQNINTVGAVDLTTVDGKRLRSRILGLSYFDGKQAILIAQITNSFGLLVGENQVWYTNAFGGVRADVQYIYSKAGLSQNIVLREQPPSPAKFGLDPVTTQLQVITEFFEPPQPQKKAISARNLTEAADQLVDFGKMKIGPGRAFAIGDERKPDHSIRVTKGWVEAGGRTFLLEEVPFKQIEAKAKAKLAHSQGPSVGPKIRGEGTNTLMALKNVLPRPVAAHTRPEGKILLAAAPELKRAGFVIDYELLSGESDFTFRGDHTYYCSDNLNFGGITTFEGGAVIKFATNESARITLGDVNCTAEAYRPLVLTAKDDNSIGESITGSTGIPTNWYGSGLSFGPGMQMSNVKAAFLRMPFDVSAGHVDGYRFANVQAASCYTVFSLAFTTLSVDNGLFYQSDTIFNGSSYLTEARNITVNRCRIFANDPVDFTVISVTNSLLVDVTNLVSSYDLYTNCVAIITSASEIFESVGAGFHYLKANSVYRNVGTTNISADLLGALKTKTTYPPIVLSNTTILTDTTWWPQAQRDTDQPDLGYHYDPLDYITRGVTVTNSAALTIASGTAIGRYNAGPAITLKAYCPIYSEGTSQQRNYFAIYSFVQEQPLALGGTGADNFNDLASPVYPSRYPPGHSGAIGRFRFTTFDAVGEWDPLLTSYNDFNNFTDFIVQDCCVRGGFSHLGREAGGTFAFKNNLFERAILVPEEYSPVGFTNNLFQRGAMAAVPWTSGLFKALNNSFDHIYLEDYEGSPVETNNAYITWIYPPAITNILSVTNATDVFLTNFNYAVGDLGRYYQVTTNLVNKGNTTADLLGLYHYTTRTNLVSSSQVKETNSVVDIGFHYVATGSNGLPIDSDGDGIPDYLEDTNGNGNGGDDATSWLIYNSPNGLSGGSGLLVFTPLK